MEYGKENKSGIGLSRDTYADRFAGPEDIHTLYMVTLHGETIAENEDPHQLAKDVYSMIERLHTVYAHLNRFKRKV